MRAVVEIVLLPYSRRYCWYIYALFDVGDAKEQAMPKTGRHKAATTRGEENGGMSHDISPFGSYDILHPTQRPIHLFTRQPLSTSQNLQSTHPPSTVRISPDIYILARLAKKTMDPLKSSGRPHLPAGMRSSIDAALFSSLIRASFMSV